MEGVIKQPSTREDLLEAMHRCHQISGMTILQHGEMVSAYYRDLMGHLRHGSVLAFEWRLPEWARDSELLTGVPDDGTMDEYHVYHDCGKPYCRTVDEDGRQHFPDHAAVSKAVWLMTGGDSDVGDLIGMDMDIHLLKGEGVDAFARRPQARALLLTGLAEVHANASMFGGVESVSFKMKWKHLDKRGRAIMKAIAAMEVPMAA